MNVIVRLLSCLWVVNAYPQMLINPNNLKGNNGKCSTLAVPPSTIVHVTYHILQEKENDDTNKDKIQKEKKKEKKKEQDSSIQRQEKETDMNNNNNNNNQMDIVIEPIPKEPTKKDEQKKEDGRHRHANTKQQQQQQNDGMYKKSKTTLQKMMGTIEYVTDPSFQGHLQICVIPHNTKNNKKQPQQQQQQPSFVSLRIKLAASSSLVSSKDDKKKKRYKTTHLTISHEEAKQQIVEQSIDYLTDDIQHLTNGLVELHHTADEIESIESDLYYLSTDMNSAASWWPVIRLIILIITGFTQAHHMMDFFRKHHII